MTKTATIVGAGPAGSMLAIYLAKQGYSVTAYESRPDMREVDISAGRSINLALATRGIEPLKAVGVMAEVEDILLPMHGRLIHDEHGNTSVQPYGSQPHEYINSVSRSALNSILLDAAEATGQVTIHFNMRCRGVDIEAQIANFSNEVTGQTSEVGFTTLFGTDGAASAVRDDLLAANGGKVDIAPLEHGYKELTIPAGENQSFLIEDDSLHIWPRRDFMLIALPDLGGTFTVTLFLANQHNDASFENLDDDSQVTAFFEEHFSDFMLHVANLEEQFAQNPHGRLATVRTKGWTYQDKVVLVGDAAHGVVPFHGQGMNAAFESCAVLDRCMREHPDDNAKAFSEFERIRKPDTDAIAQMAIDNYAEMSSSVIDEQYQLKRALALELERRWPLNFKPRYAMVMFHTMPYSEAQSRAVAQAEILNRLTAAQTDLESIDWDLAEMLINELPIIAPMKQEA